MKSALTLVAAIVIACQAAGAVADPAQRVTLKAEPPNVEISPLRPGRQFLDLPALEFSFDVEARCGEEWVPESLSLNVADSRVAFGAGQLSGEGQRKVVLNVPARQLPPVAVHDFCLLDDEPPAPLTTGDTPPLTTGDTSPLTAGDTSPLTVRAVASAHASLTCRSEQESRITYVSQPLDVTLTCKTPVADETGD